ncbi:MAG: DUF2845 domain-containing protein [Gammaproteobacteria bacterium]|nr:DUF2845 domain-containing protein [Gammaproteobacteria bacterium]
MRQAQKQTRPIIRTSAVARVRGEAVKHPEEWTYDSGSQYLLQKVIIESGRVQNLETVSWSRYQAKLPR